jgi:hypothetical protein
MSELRKLFLFTVENDMKIRTQYIRSAAKIWADKVNMETDTSNRQLAKRVYKHLDTTFHKYTIDRFALKYNK